MMSCAIHVGQPLSLLQGSRDKCAQVGLAAGWSEHKTVLAPSLPSPLPPPLGMLCTPASQSTLGTVVGTVAHACTLVGAMISAHCTSYAEEAGREMRAAGMGHELMVELGPVYRAAADEWLVSLLGATGRNEVSWMEKMEISLCAPACRQLFLTDLGTEESAWLGCMLATWRKGLGTTLCSPTTPLSRRSSRQPLQSYALHACWTTKNYSDMRVTIRSSVDAARGQH